MSDQVASNERSHLRIANLSFVISSSPACPFSILTALNCKPPCRHMLQDEWEEPSLSPLSFSFELTGARHRALQRFTSCCPPFALCFVCKTLTAQLSVSCSNISDCSSQRSSAPSMARSDGALVSGVRGPEEDRACGAERLLAVRTSSRGL